ncbi:MAG: tetratricopeptide repeat protein [Desulfofustis sp.]|nr:tetratricopeptide repeat protein [Desulfofustis sp.]
MTGDYSEAEESLRQSLAALGNNETIHSLFAEVLTLTGRSREALQVLKPFVAEQIASVQVLVQFGNILTLHGRRSEAEFYYLRAISYYDRGLVFEAGDIAFVGVACRELERFHDANNLFREAARLDPENLEIQQLWGDLFSDKYNKAEARRSYEEILKQNKNYVPALVGMAIIEGGHAAHILLDSALEINPRSVPALVARAILLSEDEHHDEAVHLLERALQINPESIEAMAILAAIAFLKDDIKTFQQLEKQVAELSPGNGEFYTRIAEICGRSYRFDKAVEMARIAVELNDRLWSGHTTLGMNLLRKGDELKAKYHLEEGFRGDPFNVRAMNLLQVLEVLDGYETRTTEHFVVRLHPSETNVLWPYLKPLLEESWNTLTAKYEFIPEGPILIELFSEHEDFAVRTSGLPNIGHLLGVCFGSVITLGSPKGHTPPGTINWQEVVWHEFTHVITLQMTKNNIPRWLSEGISVFEEKNGRPEWGRYQEIKLIKAVQDNRIIGLNDLNGSFSRARSLEDLDFAYYQSSLLVEFIVERYGFEKLKKVIHSFADQVDIGDVFLEVFAVPLEQVEKQFISWVNHRVEMLDVDVDQAVADIHGWFSSHSSGKSPMASEEQKNALIEALFQLVTTSPRNFYAHFQLGLVFYADDNLVGALDHLTIASELLPNYSSIPNPRQILAAIYEELGDTKALIRELEALIQVKPYAYDACLKLARAAQSGGNYDRVADYLEKAISLNPYDQGVHRLLAAAAMEQLDYGTAIREYTVLLALDDTDPALANTNLAEAFLLHGQKAEAKRYALAALEIAPMFERAQDILLSAVDP